MSGRLRVVLLVVALALIAVAVLSLPVTEWLTTLLAWIREHREIAWGAFIALYIVAAVLLLPGLILTIAAGFIFGLPAGVVLVSVSSVLGRRDRARRPAAVRARPRRDACRDHRRHAAGTA